MWPEIIAGVIGRMIEGRPAVLKDVRRLKVTNQVYPALVPADGGEVNGVFYENLRPEDFVALDRFEGPEYDRRTVTVFIDGKSMPCETYFTSGIGMAQLEPTDWMPADLTSENLRRFRETYKGWD